MKLYIDLDGTIFNTEKLYDDVMKFLISHNITEKMVKDLEKDLFKENYEYNLDILLSHLSNDIDINETYDLYNNNYVFDDVIPIIIELKKSFEVILLTCGSYSYQKHKIDASNIRKYFDDIIIVDKNKSKLDIDYKNGVFIDNNPKEIDDFISSGAKVVVRIKRKEDKKHFELECKNIVKEFSCFNSELLDYLLNLQQN